MKVRGVRGNGSNISLPSSLPINPSQKKEGPAIKITDSLSIKSSSTSGIADKRTTQKAQPKRYLNIFWNQHQPYYKDELRDTYTAPWVRLHATKDYYDMAAILLKYPNVHVTINLSSSLLRQLVDYVDKLKPFADPSSPTYLNRDAFPWGKLDRELDLLMKPVEKWTEEDKRYAISHMFAADYKAQIERFPGYKYLWDKRQRGEKFTDQDFRDLKVWFTLAWMDPDFLKGPVKLIGTDENGKVIHDETKFVHRIYEKGMKAGYGPANFTEEDAEKLVLDTYKIMKFVIPIHRYLQDRGQIEVVTTPFYHPILPLVEDTNLAEESNPGMLLPPRFHAPEDAEMQVKKAVALYKKLFGRPPRGMWPGEGAVSEKVIRHFINNGVKWISTGDEVLFKSGHAADNYMPYRIDVDNQFLDGDNSDAMTIVFRSLHDKIGYDFGALRGKPDGYDAAWQFINTVKSLRHFNNTPQDMPYFITQQADGENCWQYYSNDGKDFLNALYSLLNHPDQIGIYTTTPSKYIKDVMPVDKQWELEPLATGSWVGGNLSTWIGEPSENQAWNLLRLTRNALIKAGVPEPKTTTPPDPENRKQYLIWRAWESIFAAEGSDWFWWMGNDQDSGNDKYFARQFRRLLIDAIVLARQAGYDVPFPEEIFKPLDADKEVLYPPAYSKNPQIIGKPAPGETIEIRTQIEGGKPKEVYVDLSTLGLGVEKMSVTGNIASLKVKLPRFLPGKRYIARIRVEDNHGNITEDYVVIKPQKDEFLISTRS